MKDDLFDDAKALQAHADTALGDRSPDEQQAVLLWMLLESIKSGTPCFECRRRRMLKLAEGLQEGLEGK